jgi:CheY-like chemotaxis protein
MTKLLLAEDDEFSRDMLARRLQRSGFEVTTAVDGREALLAARRDRPDVILLDLDMPVMDGHAVMRSLAIDPRTSKIPLIVLTAHGKPQDVAQAVALGCHSYEVKPVPLRRLLERIEEALGPRSTVKTGEDET